MFGNLGGAGTSTTGAFGGAANTTSAFGAPKAPSAFGAFGGGTTAFGTTPAATTTSAFGQPANNTATPSVFGQPAASTSAFGGTGASLFGNVNKTSAFGTTALSGATTGAPPTITTGSSNPAYAATIEKDGTTNLQFQSISCMPAYIGYSFEELRVQDYSQNRKTASTANTFGGTAFGTAQPAAAGAFGQTTQPTNSLFGAPANPTNTTTGSAFGTFGQTQQPAAATTSLFGASGTSAFGQQQQQQPAQNTFGGATTGLFGQPQQQQQQQPTTGLFGGNTAFGGNAAPKPFGGAFGGATTTAPSAFGAAANAFGTTQPQNQQQPAQTTGLFGNAQPANNTGSAFGGAFGNNNAPKPGLFGSTATQPAAPSTFGGAFGAQQQQPQQQTSLFGNSGTTGGIFGNAQQQPGQQQQQPAQTTSLFGNQQQAPAAPSLFGNNNANPGTGLFGNPQQNQQATQQPANPFGNLFAPKPPQPAGTGLFGNSQGQVASQQQPQQNSIFGKSLFNNTPAAAPIGSSMSTMTGMSNNLFGQTMNNAAPQHSLTASIAQPIGDNLPIFDMLPPGPRIVDLDANLPKKKAGFFADMPTRSPVPRVQLGYTPANSKLRGFGSSGNLGSSSLNGGGISLTNGKPGALALNKSDMRASSVGPDFLGRSGSPALGSGGRQSVKKVILDKRVDPSELFVKTSSPGGSKYGKVTFSAQLSVASREKDAQIAASSIPVVQDSPTRQQQLQLKNTGSFGQELSRDVQEKGEKNESELEDGDYYVKPDLLTLKKAGYDDLSAFPDLVVGRKGYGEIHFLEPVDLTGLPKLGALLGEVIRFDLKECSVYPDSEESDKPPPGSGLNVSARLILVRCWPQDKATREPVKDQNHPQMVKHLKRLKGMKDTHFEGFDMTTGTWTFTVDHF
ncbi:hypothetical protein CPB83DRAFT_842534 [Crepidotus variabilis]|uniref:Peptidase S59 domain-containing protein n=1 Tax=Crepidotus variabilis TaxID=179855 RepID=A0A9P6ESG3_9AGAR|nr:hypothetical protein CPB83DRAFT_842534 [Crepidotus variabilis]